MINRSLGASRLVRSLGKIALLASVLWAVQGGAAQTPPAAVPDGPAVSVSDGNDGPTAADEPVDRVMAEADVLIKRGAYGAAFKQLTQGSFVLEHAQRAGTLALATAQYSELERFAKRWHSQDPHSEIAERFWAIALLEMDRRPAAKNVWQDILTTRYDSKEQGYLQIRESFSSLKNLAGAVWVMNELVKLNPDLPAARLNLAILAIDVGNGAVALDAIRPLVDQSSLDIGLRREAQWLEVRAYTAMGGCTDALSVLQSMIGSAAKPADREHLLKGLILSQCHRSEEAIAELLPLVKSKTVANEALQAIAQEYQSTHQWQAAANRYQELARRGEEARAALGLAQIARATDRPVDALSQYFKVSGSLIVASRLDAYGMLLDVHQDELAARILDHYIETTPDDAATITPARIELLTNHSKFEQSRALAERSIKSFPELVSLQLAYSNVLDRSGDAAKALSLLEKLHHDRPDDPDVENALGFTLTDHRQRLPEAYALIKAALDQRPDSGAIIDSLGWWYFQKGELDDARLWLEKAFERIQDPENAWHLGTVWLALGKPDEANRVWQHGLEFAPYDERLRQALKRVDVH